MIFTLGNICVAIFILFVKKVDTLYVTRITKIKQNLPLSLFSDLIKSNTKINSVKTVI